MTCQLDKSKKLETLRLSFGIQDYATTDEDEATVSFYLEGDKVSSYKISPGIGKTAIFDVANVDNIAIEVECSYSENYLSPCPNVSFVEAILFPE